MDLPLFSESPRDECGVAAVYLKKELSHYPPGGSAYFLQKMLLQLQHRGQLSAGFTIYSPEKPDLLKTHKGNGLVNEVFSLSDPEKATRLFREHEGKVGIGHTRYATSGGHHCDDAQPFERVHSRIWKWFAFGFNGNIANAREIRDTLLAQGYHFRSHADTEVVMHAIAHQLGGDAPHSLETAFTHVADQLDGAFSLVFVNAQGELCALRDRQGFKPLCYADTEDFFLVASESVALLPFVKASQIIDVKPGEIIRVSQNKIIHSRSTISTHKISHCMFEWVYFASAGSTMQGVSVYDVRWRLGVELARGETLSPDPSDCVVVNVPDTSKPAADGYAYTLSLPSKEGLLRNRYVGRTFISGGKWQDRVKEKFTINQQVMEGKKVILVEDSIVRGSTLRELVIKIKEEGKAREVHARISCPPILNPCFYGIDMTTFGELMASAHAQQNNQRERVRLTEEEMRVMSRALGTDSLRYQTHEGLVSALRLPKENICMACVDGNYPTPTGKVLVEEAWQHYLQKTPRGRVYDTESLISTPPRGAPLK